ncbi:MAG: hypothetical protein JNL12_13045 [Planctomycetes bacterium]|nr:hypothetical protein [Planctomycetota bacterium]
MIGRTRWIQVLATLVCFAACSPAPQSELADVALELRALRLQLRATGTAGPDVATGVADAMAPLREVLQGIVATQREQERRQLQLAQEVQRWGHLVAESLAPAKGEEARAVAARLQELEQKLKEQDERHQKVEELVGTALDRASEQLDRFLRRLPVPAPVEAAPEATEGGAAPVVPTQGTVAPPPRQSRVWLWVGLLGLSLAASAVLFGLAWRMRGAARPGGAARDVGSDVPLGIRAQPSTSEVAAEPGADRLWAAAALLGEAVETLRARQTAAQERPSVPPSDTLDDLSIEDLFVVEGLDEASLPDELEPDRGPAALPAAAPAPPKAAVAASSEPSAKRAVPEEVTVRMRPKDGKAAQHDLLRILHGDPRILQRPAPRLEAQGGQLVVRFALLPGLPAGERSVLEQRLRDSVA